jgi:cell division transport system permease protein
MKLVGATRAFIRAPFLLRSAFLGLFSAFLAILMLMGILFFIRAQFVQMFEIFRLDLLLVVMGIVIAAGVLICVFSTWHVVNRLVSLNKDELYY